MPNLLRSLLGPRPANPRLYDNWGSYSPGGMLLGISETNPYQSVPERLAAYRGWVYVATSTIAADVASLGVTISGPNGDPLPDHPMHARLKAPNPWTRGNAFRQVLQLHLDLAGEFFVYADRGKSGRLPPQALHILSPDRVFIVPDAVNYIQGYIYYGWSGERLAFLPHEILHVKYGNPMDAYRGMSPVQALGFAPKVNEGLRSYIANYLGNDSTAGGLLSTEQELTEEQAAALRVLWEQQHAAYRNANRVAVLGQGVKYQQVSSSISDLAVKELSEWGRDDVLAAYNMPATKLGLTTNYNHSDAEAAERTYEDTCLQPRATLWSQDFYEPLLAMYGDTALTVTVESPSGEDTARIFEESTKQFEAGALTLKQYLTLTKSPFADEAPEGVRILPGKAQVVTDLTAVAPPGAGRALPNASRELQAAIRAAAAAEYADRKSGKTASADAARWATVLGSVSAAAALKRELDSAVRRDGLVAAYERLKGPGAKAIAMEWDSHAA